LKKQAADILTEEKIEKALSRLPSLSGGVLVAFSGGADSRALLHYLVKKSKKQGFAIAAAHLNHGIRGEEADRDQIFCKKVCNEYGIHCFTEKVDIPKISREKAQSTEEAAREARYALFSRICTEHPEYSLIATAHNSDDSLETQLFNLGRGSGAKGLCGIPIKRQNIIRPLIYCTKEEILEYCRCCELDYVFDSTNATLDYTRNKIRHNIIRQLNDIFPSIHSHARRSAELIQRDCACLDSMAQDYIAKHATPLKCSELKKLHPAICSRVLLVACKQAGVKEPTLLHIEAIMSSLNSSEPKSFSLPQGVTLRIEKDVLDFGEDKICAPYQIELNPGMNVIDGTEYAIFIETPEVPAKYDTNIYNLFIQVSINSATINGHITARQRLSGDRIKRNGRTHSVKKLLCDMKLTGAKRSRLPIICDSEGILLIPGYGTRDLKRSFAQEGYSLYVLTKNTIDSDIEDNSKESFEK
jgi:tRNA(Ile)-lysidine synthase